MYRKRVPAATRDQKFGFLFIYWKDFHIHVSSWDEVEVKGIKTYFNIDENISSEQIDALLDNINSDNQEEIYISINDSDAEFIADEEILPTNNTLNTSLISAEANIHVVRDNE